MFKLSMSRSDLDIEIELGVTEEVYIINQSKILSQIEAFLDELSLYDYVNVSITKSIDEVSEDRDLYDDYEWDDEGFDNMNNVNSATHSDTITITGALNG